MLLQPRIACGSVQTFCVTAVIKSVDLALVRLVSRGGTLCAMNF